MFPLSQTCPDLLFRREPIIEELKQLSTLVNLIGGILTSVKVFIWLMTIFSTRMDSKWDEIPHVVLLIDGCLALGTLHYTTFIRQVVIE